MIKNELKAVLTNKLLMVGLIVALFIPTLYSATFLWAFWDPYEYTENIKVAVVNDDQPFDILGDEVHFGKEMTAQLKKNKDFDWHFVDKDKAEAGMRDNTYSMMIEIPKDFSEKVGSIFTENARQPVIYYVPNQAKNYLISMVQNSMIQQLKSDITATITENFMKVLVHAVPEIEGQVDQVKSSLGDLSEGLLRLQEPLESSIAVNAALPEEQKQSLQESLHEMVAGTEQLAHSFD